MVAALFLLSTSVAKAESSEVAGLRQEVEALKRTVEHLDARVESLERGLSGRTESSSQASVTAPTPPNDSPSTAVPDLAMKDRWRGIRHGMTLQQIETVLGQPQRTMKLTSGTMMWYYSYHDIGNGSVVFAPDGTVVDWQPPPFHTWWGF